MSSGLKPGPASSSARSKLALGVAVLIPTAFLAIFFLYPVLALTWRGLVPAGEGVDVAGVWEILSRPRTGRIIAQTLTQAVVGTVVSLALGIPGAYLLYRVKFPGQAALRALVIVPFVLPTVVVGVAFRSLLADGGPLGFLGLDRTVWALFAALVFFNYAVVVRTVGSMWMRLDPRAEQAARALGATPAQAFRTVTLPALTPAIVSAASLVFLFCATAYGIVRVLAPMRWGTVETEIYVQTTQYLNLQASAVLSIVQTVIVIVALIAASKARARTERSLQVRSAPPRPARLTARTKAGRLRPGGDLAAAVVTGVVVAGLIATPLAGLVARAFQGPDGAWNLDNFRNLSTTGGGALQTSVWQAAENSLRTALDATVIALVVGILISLVLSRRPRTPAGHTVQRNLDGLVMLPLGVSAVVVGFGILIALDTPPLDLRSSPILIPIAQAVVAIPFVVRTSLPVLRAIDPAMRHAAMTLGASPGRVLATIDGPYLVRACGLAIGFAFAVSLGEFGATSFLSRPDFPTLPVTIVQLIGRPGAETYGMAMAAALLLAVITATVMSLAERVKVGEAPSW